MNWLQRTVLSQVDVYLSSLGVDPEVINFVLPQENKQWYINQLRKNPSMGMGDIQTLSLPQKQSPYTEKEQSRTKHYNEPFRTWALVQYKKLRVQTNPIPDGPGFTGMMDYDYSRNVMGIGRDVDLIYDWWRLSEPTPEISSFSFVQAMQAQETWHKAAAGEGEGEVYEPTELELVVFNPHEWNGWTVQKVTSKNDLEVEGNRMNHCVGQYSDYVHSGQVEIYSLRDPKNEPHVTIEINPEYNEIVQIKGNSNREPDDKYRVMVKEWFQVLQKERPGLKLGYEDLFNFDSLTDVNNDEIDEEITRIVFEANEYGLVNPLNELDIQNAYDQVVGELTHYPRNRYGRHDTRYADYIGKSIAEAAWAADEFRAKQYDLNDESQLNVFKSESYQKGVDWLWNTIQKNEEKFFDDWYYEPYVSRDAYESEEEYEEAWQEEESRAQSEARSEYIPGALDDAIAENLVRLSREHPFLPEHKQFQAISSSWLRKIL